MTISYYMTFRPGHHGSPDRVGGQPSYLPTEKPWPAEDEEFLGFVMELQVDGTRLSVPGTIYIQLYQPIDEGDNPTPEIVHIRPEGLRNTADNVQVHPHAPAWDIGFEVVEEPDEMPEELATIESCAVFKSKLVGLDPWQNDTGGRKFLGQIKESQTGLNFGGLNCGLYLEKSGIVVAELR